MFSTCFLNRFTSAICLPAIVLSIVILNTSAFAQRQDARLWAGLDITQPFRKGFDFNVGQQFRWDQNLNRFDGALTDIELKFKLMKGVKVGAGYRFSLVPNGFRNRFHLLGSYKKKFGDFALGYRIKYQSASVWLNTFDKEWRHKLQLSWHASKNHDPFLFSEGFQSMSGERRGLSEFRFGLGNEFDVGKRRVLEAAFFFQRQLNQTNPTDSYVFALFYKLERKKPKKKKD